MFKTTATVLSALALAACVDPNPAPNTGVASAELADPVVNIIGQVAIDFTASRGGSLCVVTDPGPDVCDLSEQDAQDVVDNGDPATIYSTLPHVFGRTPRGFEHGIPDSIDPDGVTVSVYWQSAWLYPKNLWALSPEP